MNLKDIKIERKDNILSKALKSNEKKIDYNKCPVCGADMNTHIATVGDEVINPKNGEKFIVHRIYTNNNIFYYDGFNTDDFYIQENTKNWKPTGNHYDEIESLINKIGRQ